MRNNIRGCHIRNILENLDPNFFQNKISIETNPVSEISRNSASEKKSIKMNFPTTAILTGYYFIMKKKTDKRLEVRLANKFPQAKR